jgi:DNA polymerase III psi subunit
MYQPDLQQELQALQSNPGFLQAFLPEEVYIIHEKVNDTDTHLQAVPVENETIKVQPHTEKPVETDAKAATEQIASQTTEIATKSQEVTADVKATIETENIQPLVAASKPVLKSYAQKYVIWTQQSPTADERELIKSILKAVQIPFNNTALETTSKSEEVDWSTAAMVFAFGIKELPGENNRAFNWKGGRFIKAAALHELKRDVEAKKALWGMLKSTFKV